MAGTGVPRCVRSLLRYAFSFSARPGTAASPRAWLNVPRYRACIEGHFSEGQSSPMRMASPCLIVPPLTIRPRIPPLSTIGLRSGLPAKRCR